MEEGYKKYMTARLNKMFDEILFSIEGAVRSEYQYNILRKRILRFGNNALRDMLGEMEYYDIEENDKPRARDEFRVD